MAARSLESHAAFVMPLLDRGLEVLDAGCGPGTITQGIAESVLPGHVTGIDRDPNQIARASRLAEGLELTNARFLTGSVYELPFERDSFDLVFSHALLEHLAAPETAIQEFRRVMRPGGLIALCSPDWNEFRISCATPEAAAAIDSYRELQETNGGDTGAGGRLADWLGECGFGVLHEGRRFEDYESAMRIATYLAVQLDGAGRPGHARALLDWSMEPGATLTGCWKHVIGIKWNQ